jgi:hypothetical protein
MEKYILKELSLTEYEIIGSYDDPNINNNVISDIDAQNKIIYDDNDIEIYKRILEHFKEVFKKFKDNKRIVITDFKCGIGKAGKPYRWKYKDIQRGYLYDDNDEKIYFIDQLQKQSIIKIDILTYIKSQFIEITMNYYFNFGDIDKSYQSYTFEDILTSIKKDIIELREEGNFYKSLKRLNSYNRLKNKSNKNLLKIINSNFGILSRNKTLLEGLLYAMENKSKFNKEDIKSANPNNLTKEEIKNKIDDIDKEINSEELIKIIDKYKLF